MRGIGTKASAIKYPDIAEDEGATNRIGQSTADDILALSGRTKTVDPIWAAIERHRNAQVKFSKAAGDEFASEGNIPERKCAALKQITADATDDMLAAGCSLLTTIPTTLPGAIAVLRYVEFQFEDFDGMSCDHLPEEIDDQPFVRVFLGTLTAALIAI